MATEDLIHLPKPGDVIDGFTVGERLHEGGMAVIYRAEKAGFDLPLAMKVPKLDFGNHPACLVGFEAEQMILESLSGPHVPRFIAKGQLEERPYLVMEYLPGTSLAEHARRAPQSTEELVRLMLPVANAVHQLHRQDVVHHDLKPENIRYRESGEAVLLDFGLACHSRLPDLVEEEFQLPVGTSAYIAPEQIHGLRGHPASDLFALGVILYELATGTLPFGMPTTLAGFRQRIYRDPPPPRALNPQLPEWLQEITLRCLEVDEALRYATAAQLAHDLAHPDQVPVGSRGRKMARDGLGRVLGRWFRHLSYTPPAYMQAASTLNAAPHVLVALDTESGDAALLEKIRAEVARLADSRGFRVTCVTVHEPDAASEGTEYQELAHGLHTQRLMELRHWAAPLALTPERLRFHVLTGSDAAETIVEYAQRNHVDLVVLGARGHSGLRRFLGSVSAKVAAEAPCSVTIVRKYQA